MEKDSLIDNLSLVSFPNVGGKSVSASTWTIG
jgi:hypothetical protein